MIRKLETNDIDEVMNIWLETNIKAHKFIDKKYWENNYNEVKKGILNADTYVFEKNNQIMGFVGIIDGYIAGIFVKESMQRNGIGKQLINKRGALTIPEVIDIMSQLTDGLSHAHEAYIIHRDIKPQNIMIEDNGTIKSRT